MSCYLLVPALFARFLFTCAYKNIFKGNFIICSKETKTSYLFLFRQGCSIARTHLPQSFQIFKPQDYHATQKRAKIVHLTYLDIAIVIMFQILIIYLQKSHSHEWFSPQNCWLISISRDLLVQPPTWTSEYSQFQKLLALSSQILQEGLN